MRNNISVCRRLDPGPGEVVTHGQGDHDGQPEEAATYHYPGQPGAVADMHKIQNHQGSLADSNGKSYHRIDFPQVNHRNFDRDARQNNQSGKHTEINLL